jgi:thiamine-phosphate pyrophosphorylase
MSALPRLLVLTDRSQLPLGRSLVSTVAACVEAGATAVVVRELDLALDRRAALAEALAALGATVIAAHTPLPAATAGVHLPGACKAVLSRLADPHRSSEVGVTPLYMFGVGRSCHTTEEVRRAADAGAAWATLGPFAATASKPGYGPAVPASEFKALPIPVFALGGMDESNARTAIDSGAHGVAVMGAIMRSPDPGRTARRLLEQVNR